MAPRRFFVSAIAGAALAIAVFTHATVAPVDDASARPAQAGSLVAFQSDRDGDSEIWVVSDNGSGLRRLTNNKDADATPAWTPDGESIIFASSRRGNWDLWRMDADGGNPVQLTFTKGDEFDPVVSPDGRRVAYESDALGNWDIYVLDLRTRQAENLSQSVRRDQDPTWSPDEDSSSARIAFTTVFGRRNADLYFVRTDAPGRVQPIVTGSTNDGDANWSVDNQIVFTRHSRASRDLFVVDPDGGDLRSVATGSTDDWGGVWADNGNILFVRETNRHRRPEPYRIWVMNRDGGRQRLLVPGGHATDAEPAPQPGSNPRSRIPTVERSLAAALAHCKPRYGTNAGETINGTAGPDCLYGRGGNDKLYGLGGNDPVLRGDAGADQLYGGSGNDTFYAADDEQDYINGGTGSDHAYADDIDTVVSAAID